MEKGLVETFAACVGVIASDIKHFFVGWPSNGRGPNNDLFVDTLFPSCVTIRGGQYGSPQEAWTGDFQCYSRPCELLFGLGSFLDVLFAFCLLLVSTSSEEKFEKVSRSFETVLRCFLDVWSFRS